jgi:hypothetical protein
MSPAELDLWFAQKREDDKRNANLVLGLPEFFNVDRELLPQE